MDWAVRAPLSSFINKDETLKMRHRLATILLAAISFVPVLDVSEAQDYDPLKPVHPEAISPTDLSMEDGRRNREIPVRVYLPPGDAAVPVILFSHGLGGSRRACGYLGQHWSARGYAVVFLQHAGSDESVWKDLPRRQRLQALKDAASGQNSIARFQDVQAALDELERWNKASDHRYHGRFDLERVGMSGHSYGASTTQGVSGQSAPRLGQRFTDKRIDAAIMLSPNIPRRATPEVAFGKIAIPWMLMTGTNDTSPINDTTVDDRRRVYPALPNSIDKYELVLHEAEHSAFGDGPQRGRTRNPNHHRVIMALSTAFWDAYLAGDPAAAQWLQGARELMEEQDLWQYSLGADSAVQK